MGRYKVVRELGRNQEGGRITYLATDTSLNPLQQVVIKEFRFAASGANWSGFKAYEREIEVMRELNHPRIPRYLDSFETKSGFCLVQEYKNALSLAVRRSFTPEDIKKIAESVLEILVYLQKRTPPVIHRDIKPENIVVDQQLNAYLVDFGFARIRGGELALSSVAAGTPGFMPPEEQFGRPLTEASDLYSLGATLICLLTGTRSLDVGNLIDDNYRFDFKKLVPQLSPRLIAWLEKMVAPNVKQRFNNAAAALEALKPIDVFGSPNTKQQLVKPLSAVALAIAAIGSVVVMNSVNQPSSAPLGSSPVVKHFPPSASVQSPTVQHSPQLNLVTNGDFETPQAGSDFVGYYANEPFPGWIVKGIDHVGARWQAASGKQSVDLSGFDAGTIYQDLATSSRQTYTLRFALAGNVLAGNSPSRVKQMEVWWGSALVDTLSFDTTPHSYSSMGWKYYEYKVVAPMGVNTTRLKFVSLTPGNCGPALDDVTVTPQQNSQVRQLPETQQVTAPASSDLAYNKPVQSSGYWEDGISERAVDGNRDSTWRTNQSTGAWMYVDLGNTFQISRIILRWGWDTRFGTSAESWVEVSDDAQNWRKVATTVLIRSTNRQIQTLKFPTVKTRYVRFYGARWNDGWAELRTLEVYQN